MKNYVCLFIALCLLSIKLYAQIPITFQNTYGVGMGQVLKQTSDKGYIIIGNAYGSSGTGYAITSVVKIDSLGGVNWSESLFSGNTNQLLGYDVEQTSDGGYIISGHHLPSTGADKLTLIKLHANGTVQWGKYIVSSEYGYGIHQTNDGGYILCGNTSLTKISSTGVKQWSKRYSIASFKQLIPTSDGGYAMIGYTTNNNNDICLLKTDSGGVLTWSKIFGGSSSDIGNSIQQTNDGGYIIAGNTQSYGAGALDVYLIKTASDGTLQWAKTFGGTLNDQGNSVKQTNDSGYVITGYTASFGTGNGDVYLIKTNKNGTLQWTKTFGGASDEAGLSVEKAGNNGFVINAYTTSSFALYSTANIYLIKTDPNGHSAGCYETSPISVQDSGGVAATATISVAPTVDTTSNLIVQVDLGSSANTICTTLGIQKIELKDEISIYPNPANRVLNITLQHTETDVLEINTYDMLGKEIICPTTFKEGKYVLDVSSLFAGIYFVKLKTAISTVVQKIIKQ